MASYPKCPRNLKFDSVSTSHFLQRSPKNPAKLKLLEVTEDVKEWCKLPTVMWKVALNHVCAELWKFVNLFLDFSAFFENSYRLCNECRSSIWSLVLCQYVWNYHDLVWHLACCHVKSWYFPICCWANVFSVLLTAVSSVNRRVIASCSWNQELVLYACHIKHFANPFAHF